MNYSGAIQDIGDLLISTILNNKERNPDKILETYLGYFLPYYNIFDLKKIR